jgi:adenine-specific DNA-methyltransferase
LGGHTERLEFSTIDSFQFLESPPKADLLVDLCQWRSWGCRLRPYLLPPDVASLYQELAISPDSFRLKAVARVGIGYVSGANDFFHLKPSQARRAQIPDQVLRPSVRNGRFLTGSVITSATVDAWRRRDEPIFLLRLKRSDSISPTIRDYLDSAAGNRAREAYKCRNRDPWYVVPDVSVPDAFLSYMSGTSPALVANGADCVATNSVHIVKLNGALTISGLQDRWQQPITQLSCEIEGHPLGGGMLKLEPREAGNVLLARRRPRTKKQEAKIAEGIDILRAWRHYGKNSADMPVD